jgi:hypothetical protein
MPAGDRTGPRGMGPMTGRGAGYCAGYGMPGRGNPIPGRGPGLGRRWGGTWGGRGGAGGGWRHRNWYYATGVPGWARFGPGPAWGYEPGAPAPAVEEVEFLRQQAEWLKGQLDAVGQRIAELSEEE